jgi:DNA recombination protein Rad52
MMDWENAKAELEKKLDPAHVKKPTGNFGPKGDYIEGWHAIAEANRIFGYGNWSYTIKGLTKDSLVEAETPKGKQWQAAYTCIVTLTVGDVTREDVGFGSGFAKQIGDAIEGATKEAVTDALKRALRTFGNPFGLALYDKSRANVGRDIPQAVIDAANGAADTESLRTVWVANAEWHDSPDFRDAVNKRKHELEKEAA